MALIRKINFLALIFFCLYVNAQDKHVLVFHKTQGFQHESIAAGYQAITDLGEKNGFTVKQTDNAEIFESPELSRFDLVIFLSTSGDIFNQTQKQKFESYIEAGGSFFGIHSATNTEYDWEWYGDLIGAYFTDHPEIQTAEINVLQPNHPTVAHLPPIWTRTDEWYNYHLINGDIQILLNLDESTYKGGDMGKDHPIAWYRELPGGGRSVYTGGGHTIESYVEPLFVEHILQCILFAMESQKGED